MKRLIAAAQALPGFGRGSIEFLNPDNPRVLAFCGSYEDETVVWSSPTSRGSSSTSSSTSATYRRMVPVELFAAIAFPAGRRSALPADARRSRALLVLARAPENFEAAEREAAYQAPTLDLIGSPGEPPSTASRGRSRHPRRQEAGSDPRKRPVSSSCATVTIPVPRPPRLPTWYWSESSGSRGRASSAWRRWPSPTAPMLIASGRNGRPRPSHVSATATRRVRSTNPSASRTSTRHCSPPSPRAGRPPATGASRLRPPRTSARTASVPESRLIEGGQRNCSVAFGDRLVLKLFRRIDEGVNPELELGRFLTSRGFRHVPANPGCPGVSTGAGEPMPWPSSSVTCPTREMPGNSRSTRWDATTSALSQPSGPEDTPAGRSLLDLAGREPPAHASRAIGAFLETARLIGQRTAEFHVTLASEHQDPAFAPVPLSALDQRSIYQSMRGRAGRILRLLARSRENLPKAAHPEADAVLASRHRILDRLGAALSRRITATRHPLPRRPPPRSVAPDGQGLRDHRPRRGPEPPPERAPHKRSPLRDVASLLGSFHYASHAAWSGQSSDADGSAGSIRREDMPRLEPGSDAGMPGSVPPSWAATSKRPRERRSCRSRGRNWQSSSTSAGSRG